MSSREGGAQRPFAGRRILLGVTGGIAAYKSIQLARDCTMLGALVDVVLTPAALEFVQPLSFEALTGRPAHTHSHTPGDPLLHIRLAREADLVVVAPATANFIARAAGGLADDLLTSILLATQAPVLVCPAMNDRMFAHPLTQANLTRLAQVGYRIAGPASGPLAWGEGEGPGRLIDHGDIISYAARLLEGDTPLTGKRIVVTAGPTREPIDPVRFLGNRSSGRMGFALAASAWRRGADVTLIHGPTSLPVPAGVDRVAVETAEDMNQAVRDALPGADALLMAAAVADFRIRDVAPEKLKKESGEVPVLDLEPTADILRSTRSLRPPRCVVVGFALETEKPIQNGAEKLRGKDLDLLVVNDALEPGAGFEVPTNRVTILSREGETIELPLLSKDAVADEILDRVASRLEGGEMVDV